MTQRYVKRTAPEGLTEERASSMRTLTARIVLLAGRKPRAEGHAIDGPESAMATMRS